MKLTSRIKATADLAQLREEKRLTTTKNPRAANKVKGIIKGVGRKACGGLAVMAAATGLKESRSKTRRWEEFLICLITTKKPNIAKMVRLRVSRFL